LASTLVTLAVTRGLDPRGHPLRIKSHVKKDELPGQARQ
jgi:hypothetical protein